MKHFAVAVLLASIAGASPAGASTTRRAPVCTLSALERRLIEVVVTDAVADAMWEAGNAHDVDRSFALSLVGGDIAYLGAVTRIGDCTKAKTFVPTCERDREAAVVRCVRLGCEAPNVAGTVTSDPFPSVTWRTVEIARGTYAVSANVFRRPVLTPSDGASIDLTHSGAISAKVADGELASLEVELAFDDTGVASGRGRRVGETLATLSGTAGLAFAWSD